MLADQLYMGLPGSSKFVFAILLLKLLRPSFLLLITDVLVEVLQTRIQFLVRPYIIGLTQWTKREGLAHLPPLAHSP